MIRRMIPRPVSCLGGLAGPGPTWLRSSDGTHVPQRVGSMKIDVRDNQIEPALKALKKQMLKDGLFQEMKRREPHAKTPATTNAKKARAQNKTPQPPKRDTLPH